MFQKSDSSDIVCVCVCVGGSTQYLFKSMLYRQYWCFIFWRSCLVWWKRGRQGICHLLISFVASAWLTCDVSVTLWLWCSCITSKSTRQGRKQLGTWWMNVVETKVRRKPSGYPCVCVCVVRSSALKIRFHHVDTKESWTLVISFFFFLSGNNLSFDLFLVIWFVCALKIVHMKTKTKKWGLLDCNMKISYLLHNTPLHQTKTSSVVSELSLTLLIFFPLHFSITFCPHHPDVAPAWACSPQIKFCAQSSVSAERDTNKQRHSLSVAPAATSF